ncbi:MAG: ABC transporter ATP-binding protein [Bacteroidota bacterium]
MIQIENVSKEFKLNKKQKKELAVNHSSIKAVDGVSFECKPGRIFSILGPNGAGKTTLLRMVATILKPTEGNIQVAGLDVEKQGQEVRRKIGFLTGSTGLYERLTVNELVKYFADLYHVGKSDFEENKARLYDLLGIHSFASKRIGQLSTGMKQKVSIVRTMIHSPEVVVFDEPTSGLDVITAENIIALIRSCKEDGRTVIFSSHIMSEVDLLCDDLAIIHQGRIVHKSTMEDFRVNMKTKSLTEAFINIINQN